MLEEVKKNADRKGLKVDTFISIRSHEVYFIYFIKITLIYIFDH